MTDSATVSNWVTAYRTAWETNADADIRALFTDDADYFFGPAQRLHGATYAIDLEVRAPGLGPHQVVMDIGALRNVLRSVLSGLDYANLDEHAPFKGMGPTKIKQFGEAILTALRATPEE